MKEEQPQHLSAVDPLEPLEASCSRQQQQGNSPNSSLEGSPRGGYELQHNSEYNKQKDPSPEKDGEKSPAISAKYVAYLGCIKDNWSSCHAAKLLDEELIAYLRPRFVLLSTPLKVRVLTSLLYIKAELRDKCSDTLSEITQEGETDPNEWVKKLSRILIPYINSGMIDLRETDTETAFRIINFLDEQKALNPQQGPYRQKAGLEEQHMCEPHTEIETASAVAAAASSEDPLQNLLKLPQKGVLEMTLFNARDSFDNLLKGVVHRGTQELRRAQRAQQQRQRNQSEARRDISAV
ncbi:uncharacterized protein LOC34620151 [Cyclospora cayetanensis]|uniref:Uncharacterized protein LOC34620151 n=2 Tax=Cyclospora cayetanensis TaxID=88456 RepID=A0A6P5WGA5_9EIME|nr:uncharacterized protein LOC34620151 [Cyclospora cayetanensis]OEH80632.1 hypothetical protein cyc_03466 [Cyclospora cayetanensis]